MRRLEIWPHRALTHQIACALGGIRFVFISPEELHVPSYIIDEVVKPSGCEYKEVRTMDEVLPELDVLYMTRVQRERLQRRRLHSLKRQLHS